MFKGNEMADNCFKKTFELKDERFWAQRKMRYIRLSIILVALFCLPCVVFNIFFCQIKVIGVSMKPTFNINLTDGLSEEEYMASPYQDTVIISRILESEVGDIVIVSYNNRYIVKRLIAKGGQKVTLKREEGTELYAYYVDGVKLNEPYIGENYLKMSTQYFWDFRLRVADETGTDEASITVPEGKIFVLGDNRGVSQDSHRFGCLEESKIFGKVVTYYQYDSNLFLHIFSLIFKK